MTVEDCSGWRRSPKRRYVWPAMETDDLEALAQRLEQEARYRVLRELAPTVAAPAPLPSEARTGVVLDVETTGLSHETDVVIELAMVRFAYSAEDEVLGVVESFQSFSDPGHPLDPQVTAITGITDEMVRGQVLDVEAVKSFLGTSAFVVAHNAAFDRPFAEALCPEFSARPWACCMAEPPWADEGYEGRSLALLALQAGFFYNRHRALNDCHAALELLARPLPRSGRTGLAAMLAKIRTPTWRLWAFTPYELRGLLKARGYRWSDGNLGRPRAWYVDVVDADLDAELAFLQGELRVKEGDLLRRRMTARDRFSARI